jgi:hypothetical protein
MSVPPQLRHFLEQPIAEGNNLAAGFEAGRFDQPIAAQDRNNVIDGHRKTTSLDIVVDDRQTADRKAKSVRGRFQRQLRAADNKFAGGRGVGLAMIAPRLPVFAGRRGVNERGACPVDWVAAREIGDVARRSNRDKSDPPEQIAR